jgi:hypothetical protein
VKVTEKRRSENPPNNASQGSIAEQIVAFGNPLPYSSMEVGFWWLTESAATVILTY